MVRARIVVQKLNVKPLETEVREFIVPLADNQMFHLSEETVNEIRTRIERTIIREGSTGKLASSFFAEKTSDGYGIGNIDYLNQNCKYWHWQNYGITQSGRTFPPGNIGKFEGVPEYPTEAAIKTQKWVPGRSDPSYLMIPKKPIQAKNFIEQTYVRISDIANRILNQVK